MKNLVKKIKLYLLSRYLLRGLGNFSGFHANGKKAALVTVPFYELRCEETSKLHPNYYNASLLFAATLRSFDSVDVYNIKYVLRPHIQSNVYDIIIGFSDVYRSLCEKNPTAKKMLWLVEPYPKDLYRIEQQRLKRLKDKLGGKTIKPCFRFAKYYTPEDIDNADLVFCFGEKNRERLSRLTDAPVVHIQRPIGQHLAKTAWPEPGASECLCFAGSGGWLLKGLDIVADAAESGDIGPVHVCAPKKYQRHAFLYNQHITYYGLISPKSRLFERLVRRCRFSLLMSCGEGMPGAILTTMSAGLIPVISEHCGSKFGDLAVQLKEKEIQAGKLKNVMIELQEMSDIDLELWSKKCSEFAHSIDGRENFIESVANALDKVKFKR